MTRVVHPATGPSFYCPDCLRLLAKANPSGSFDLSAKASVIASYEADETGAPLDEVLLVDAVCLRTVCRLRRWLRTANRRNRLRGYGVG